ncbi:unnamed protein product [Leptosia nina]|uniref:Armadillo repeat-containing protein 8 n=1 Tax=Leptosia nina TaxID=320188 RepID=A0AAV1K2F8_9NEOP
MSEEVACIRENNRFLLKLNRRLHRDEINDVRRTVTNCMTKENVSEIARKLKTRAPITAKELGQLKNALMDDPHNIQVVLSVHGALRGLIRELTGANVKKQCAAAGCICNLALGDTKACTIISKAAGTYLVAAVDNLVTELAVTCVWTLGNLAASRKKVCNILTSQGALSKVMELHTNEELQDACLYALKHFVYQLGDELKPEHLQATLNTLSKLQLNVETSEALFILSCHSDFPDLITEELLLKLLEDFIRCMEHHLCTRREQELVYVTRTLANSNVCGYILNYPNVKHVCELCKKVLSVDNVVVNKSIMWLLGNIYKACGESYRLLVLDVTVVV